MSASWLLNVKRICGKTRPVTATGVHVLRDEYARSIEPVRALADETMKLERTIRDAAAEPSARRNLPFDITAPDWQPRG